MMRLESCSCKLLKSLTVLGAARKIMTTEKPLFEQMFLKNRRVRGDDFAVALGLAAHSTPHLFSF
jgi:hypothetical protein